MYDFLKWTFFLNFLFRSLCFFCFVWVVVWGVFVYFCSYWRCAVTCVDPANLNGTIVYFVQFNVFFEWVLFAIAAAATVLCFVYSKCVCIFKRMCFDFFLAFPLSLSITLLNLFNSSAQSSLCVNMVWHLNIFYSQWICEQQSTGKKTQQLFTRVSAYVLFIHSIR